MGLAADQARLLFITNRTNSIEYRMMQLTNTKLDYTRKTGDASRKYSNSLNAKKLVAADGNDLSYNSIVGNSSSSYFVTNQNGAVILDSTMASRLGGSAQTADAFNAAYTDVNSFVKQVTSWSDTKVKDAVDGNVTDGSSGSAANVDPANLTSSDVFKMLAADYPKYADSGMQDFDWVNSDGWDPVKFTKDGSNMTVCFYQAETWDKSAGTYVSSDSHGSKSINTALAETVNNVTSKASASIEKGLGKDNYGEDEWTKIQEALDAAETRTAAFYDAKCQWTSSNTEGVLWADAINGDGETEKANMKTATKGTNNIWAEDPGSNEYYIDLAQVVATFINFFNEECASKFEDTEYVEKHKEDNYEEEGLLGQTVANVVKSPDSYNNTLVTKSQYDASEKLYCLAKRKTATDTTGTETETDTDLVSAADVTKAAYYKSLYNNIKNNGWSPVDTSVNLSKMVQSEQYHINNLSNGQAVSTSSSAFKWVTDQEAVDKAKADYETEKSDISYKESILDMELNQLETEHTSLESEKESVKSLIDKQCEKFKLFA